MTKDRKHFLDEAEKLINGQRAKEYGPAKKNHQRIADIWTILLDKKLVVKARGVSKKKTEEKAAKLATVILKISTPVKK